MTTDTARLLWAVIACLLWAGLAGLIIWRHKRLERQVALKAKAMAGDANEDAIMVAYASQTGFAEELAWMTARALTEGGKGARILSFADLDQASLKAAKQVLIIASTTGEGDAPDSAGRFVRQMLPADIDLSHLSYGLLALGDRSYEEYCRFGHAIGDWLEANGASPMFDRVEVDNGETGAIRHWQHQLNQISGATDAPDWTPPAYEDWRLVERHLLNENSPGGEAWHVVLEPVGHSPQWQAGDIAEIGLPVVEGQGQISREYSVASLSSEGRAEFCIRLMTGPDGRLGLGSGWLTKTAEVGDAIPMRLRTNRSFHAPPADAPMILIGNGTGIAGLRAHIKARAEARAKVGATGGTWLMFGERTLAHDAFYDAELQGWLADGSLTRLDRCFSRDGGEPRYVQGLVSQQARLLSEWVERGAYIYVCGSLEGMSKGLHAALETVLSEHMVLSLSDAGRYRRDVY